MKQNYVKQYIFRNILAVVFVGVVTFVASFVAGAFPQVSKVLSGFGVRTALAAPDSTIYFDPSSTLAGGDSQFSLNARIDPGTNQVTAVVVDVTFDPAVLRLDSIDNTGSPFSVTLIGANIDNGSGTASVTYGVPAGSPPTPVTADAFIAGFSFHTLSSATDSPITFTSSTLASALGESGDVITTRTGAAVSVDATAPTITNISSDHSDGTFSSGEVIDVDVTFSEDVTSSGDVTVTLETGTTDRTCTFTVSNASFGTCDYTVQAGDTAGDLNVSVVSGTITDGPGNSMTDFTPATNLADNKDIVIDTAAPSGYSVVFDQTSVDSSNETNLSFTFSGAEVGSQYAYSVDDANGSTSPVTGSGTIVTDTDQITGIDVSSLDDGTLTLTVTLTDAVGNTGADATDTISSDTTAPTITNISSDHSDGTFSSGEVIDVDVTFSEDVTSSGDVTVTLETGTTDRTCTFAVSGSNTGSCDYTVQSGDTTADLNVASVSGTITDTSGNSMTDFTPATNLADNKDIAVDAVSPVISEVTSISLITRDSTPDYTFSSTKDGTITYGGDCSSSTTSASAGDNTITLNGLSVGAYTNCTVTVTDTQSNVSNTLTLAAFSVTYTSDFNVDGTVDIFDYNIIITDFGSTSCGSAADADGDCDVDIFDYNTIIGEFGSTIL